MKKALFLFLFYSFTFTGVAFGQQDTTASEKQNVIAQDDPAKFLTRFEVFNELQHFRNDVFLNITTARTVIRLGKRFTTRFDIPLVYNSLIVKDTATGKDYRQFGFGDISVRLLGARLLDSKKVALVASVEFSFNTAQSRLLGTGKNIISPTLTYSHIFPKKKIVLAFSFQQFNSLWGDESRQQVNFSRLQAYFIKAWTKKIWTVVLPELYIDYVNVGASMTLEAAGYYRISRHFVAWLKAGAGLFGDHPARYQWTSEAGIRYLIWGRPAALKKNQ